MMARFVRFGFAAVAFHACAGAGVALAAAPEWERGGRVYEVSDMPSVVVAPRASPIDGQPALPPEPESFGLLTPPAPGDVASESAEVPSLSERVQQWGERALSPPGMLAFDSAAAVEADGTVVPCSTQAGMRDCLHCLEGGCWIVRVEALALWRNAPTGRPLFTSFNNATQVAGPVVFNADQSESDPLAAPRLTIARTDDCGRGFDVSYLYAGNFYSERALPPVTDGYATAAPGIYGNAWGAASTPITSAQMKLIGSLQSGECNLREPLGWGATRFLVGFRWFQWRENWALTDTFQDPANPALVGTDNWQTDCLNNLYGGQIGLDSVLWNRGQGGLRLEGLVKAGAYYNAATQTSVYNSNSSSPFSRTVTVAGPAGSAFAGEVGLTTVVPIHRNVDLRVGYFGLWLSGLAQPTRQLGGQTLTPSDAPSGMLTTNGSVVFQGVSLGLEGRW